MRNEKLEVEILDYLRTKEIIAEQRERLKGHAETIDFIMEEQSLPKYVFETQAGDFVRTTRREKQKKSLNKGTLASELQVEKAELNTVGMVKLAEKKLLTEKHIIDHTDKKTASEVKIKLKQRKAENTEEG